MMGARVAAQRKIYRAGFRFGPMTPLAQMSDGPCESSNYIPCSGISSLPHTTTNSNNSSLPATKTHSRNSSASNIKPEKGAGSQHQRRPSTGSLISTHSMTSMSLSDTDSEAGNENDSGIEDGNSVDPTVQIALNFRRHLTGLHKSLEQMTQAASYLTQRYQHDVGGNRRETINKSPIETENCEVWIAWKEKRKPRGRNATLVDFLYREGERGEVGVGGVLQKPEIHDKLKESAKRQY
ncbi:hypothetical protein RUM43_012520 [Polyplax serrata]|uniref:Uncharacterized protein n=1 Tax=Polyplax serrata TaxID=468196 RepID=A0AAN8P527_POLSC